MADAGRLGRTVERLDDLAGQRLRSGPVAPDARDRARRLSDHLTGHILPRVRSLDAPLVVLLLGPTGAGKSSLLNSMAGRRVSPAGVLRPTTRGIVLFVRPADVPALLGPGGSLAALDPDRITVVEDAAAAEGVALLDAPDIDSIEHANRALTDRLVEAADLAVFVTTASRYADSVPWDVLGRARERRMPLLVVVNRLPAEEDGAAAVLGDVHRLVRRATLTPADPVTDGSAPGILGVREGALDPAVDGLAQEAVAPLHARIDALAADREARRALAMRALAGSVAGLEELVERVADDAEHEAIDADALRRIARSSYDTELATLRDDLARGTFLRAEALRQWHAYVGSDQLTRLFSTGLERLRRTLAALVEGPPRAPIAEVRDETLADLLALVHSRAGVASRRSVLAWSQEPRTRDLLAAHPELWQPSDALDERLDARLAEWMDSIATDVRTAGEGKRRLALGASVGVNAAGVGVMLATFAHTGGLTGAEMGIAAATAVLNQRLLEALFGDAALVQMVGRARRNLELAIGRTFDEDVERFEALVPDGSRSRELAERLRDSASELRDLGAEAA